MRASRHRVALAAIAALVLAIDQLAKWRLASALGPGASQLRITLGTPWVALDYTENRGVAFGLFVGMAPLLALAIYVAVAVVWFVPDRRMERVLEAAPDGRVARDKES